MNQVSEPFLNSHLSPAFTRPSLGSIAYSLLKHVQPRLGDERFDPPQQTNNYDINGLYLDPPNHQQMAQQDLLSTVVRHLTPPGPDPAGPPAHPPPPAAAPEHETEKPGSATICGVRRKVFGVMTLAAVLVILVSVGGGLAARFVMENRVKKRKYWRRYCLKSDSSISP
jgi:hypothetical protein